MSYTDLTSRIERLEVLEERLGIRLDRLSAVVDDRGVDNKFLSVLGELQPRDGTSLQEDIELVVAAYDVSGRVVGTSSEYYNTDSFFALETFDISVAVRLADIAQIRVYPKKQ